MDGRQANDGGWLGEPPTDPEIYCEIREIIPSLLERTPSDGVQSCQRRDQPELCAK